MKKNFFISFLFLCFVIKVSGQLTIDSIKAVQPVICNRQSSVLSVFASGGAEPYQYKWSTLVNEDTTASITVTPLTTTTYTVTITDNNNDTAKRNVTVTVNQISGNPTSATATPATICNGQSSTLTLTGGGGGTEEIIKWYTDSCGGTPAGTGNNLPVSPTSTTTYYGRYEDGNPCNYNSTCAIVTVIVNQLSDNPTSANATPAIICNGQSSTLTLTGGGGGTGELIKWYTSSCGDSIAGTGNNLSVNPAITTTYYGRYEDGTPCNNSACEQVTVTVNQKSADPTSAIAMPALICNGGSSTLTLNGGGGGTGELIKWYTSSCGGTPEGTGNKLSVSPVITTTYYGRYEDGTPCNNSACSQVTVTVNQKSADPTSAIAMPAIICNEGSSTLTLNGGGGGTGEVIKWYTSSCGDSIAGTGNNLSVSPASTTTYYGRYEDGSPCNYNSTCALVTVTVNQKSADPTSATATPATICSGQNSTLTLTGGGGGTGEVIKWYTLSCGGTLAGTGNNLSVSPATTTTYYGRYEDGTPCNNSACATVTVTVKKKSADPTSAIAMPAAICIGASSTLTLDGGGGGIGEVIKWYTSSCGGKIAGTGNNLSVSPIITTTYYGRYEDTTPCNNSACATVTITVNLLPKVTNTPFTQTICSGENTELVYLTSDLSGTTFNWFVSSVSQGISGFNDNPSNPYPIIPIQTLINTANTPGVVTYTITSTAAGCAGLDTNYIITVIPNPKVKISGVSTVCKNEYWVEYCIDTNLNSIEWSVTNGEIKTGQGTNCIKANWNDAASGLVSVNVHLWNSPYCQGSDSLPVTITDETAIKDSAKIVVKANDISTNILICKYCDYYYYLWGYENKTIGAKEQPLTTDCVTENWSLYPSQIDTLQNYYWVYIGNNSTCLNCYTKLYFNHPNFVSGISNKEYLNYFLLYPNPSNGIFNIDLETLHPNTHYQIIDLLGRIILKNSISANKFEIDMTRYNSGIYLFQLFDGNNRSTKKIIIYK